MSSEMEDLIDAAQEAFGFCQCGNPERSLRYIRDGLQVLGDLRRVWDHEYPGGYEAWEKAVDNHFKGEDAMWFFWYWCDKEGLTEHGGSVPGWLSDKGEDCLEHLQLLDLDDDEE